MIQIQFHISLKSLFIRIGYNHRILNGYVQDFSGDSTIFHNIEDFAASMFVLKEFYCIHAYHLNSLPAIEDLILQGVLKTK